MSVINSWISRHETTFGAIVSLGVSALCLVNALAIVEGRTWQIVLAFMAGLSAASAVQMVTMRLLVGRLSKERKEPPVLAGSTGYHKGMLEMHETMSGGEGR